MCEDTKDVGRAAQNWARTAPTEARSRVYNAVDTLPDRPLTTTSQIPPDLWSELTGGDRAPDRHDHARFPHAPEGQHPRNNLGTKVPRNGAGSPTLTNCCEATHTFY